MSIENQVGKVLVKFEVYPVTANGKINKLVITDYIDFEDALYLIVKIADLLKKFRFWYSKGKVFAKLFCRQDRESEPV